jgi:hypothetical protein
LLSPQFLLLPPKKLGNSPSLNRAAVHQLGRRSGAQNPSPPAGSFQPEGDISDEIADNAAALIHGAIIGSGP